MRNWRDISERVNELGKWDIPRRLDETNQAVLGSSHLLKLLSGSKATTTVLIIERESEDTTGREVVGIKQ